MADDAELLELWRAGDAAAGETLFGRHFDALYRFFRNKVGPECEDLVQRSVEACLEKRDTLREAGSFRAFLLGIARFELLRHFQRKGRNKEDGLGSKSAYDLDPSPSRIVAEREEHKLLLEALRQIPLELQVILELHYWEDLSSTEIAHVVGIPAGTVRSRIRRAKEQLEAAMAALPARPAIAQSTSDNLQRWASEIRGRDVPAEE